MILKKKKTNSAPHLCFIDIFFLGPGRVEKCICIIIISLYYLTAIKMKLFEVKSIKFLILTIRYTVNIMLKLETQLRETSLNALHDLLIITY